VKLGAAAAEVLPIGMSLRPMQLSDVEAVMAVEVRAYGHPWSQGNFVDSLTAGYLAQLMVSDEGQVLCYFVAMPGVDELHLLNITVAPERQSTGLGRLLMREVEQQARQRQFAHLWLEVRESNERARSLYRRLGLEEVGLRKGYYPAGNRREDAVVMRLVLKERAPEPAPSAAALVAPSVGAERA
jgi:[ribosomal protein S18]-alanine N-acetyltransferase